MRKAARLPVHHDVAIGLSLHDLPPRRGGDHTDEASALLQLRQQALWGFWNAAVQEDDIVRALLQRAFGKLPIGKCDVFDPERLQILPREGKERRIRLKRDDMRRKAR